MTLEIIDPYSSVHTKILGLSPSIAICICLSFHRELMWIGNMTFARKISVTGAKGCSIVNALRYSHACLEERLSSLSPSFALSPALPSHSRDDNDRVHLLHWMFVPRIFMNVLAHFKFKLRCLETLLYEKQLSHHIREGRFSR